MKIFAIVAVLLLCVGCNQNESHVGAYNDGYMDGQIKAYTKVTEALAKSGSILCGESITFGDYVNLQDPFIVIVPPQTEVVGVKIGNSSNVTGAYINNVDVGISFEE